eukprot:TRINITY_DN17034_c0_g1_i1.p1 TRINITY_DN17034_c0_g1~~TRINITY_DN17034_c0_g1_i1.p1  ORF type:complete len:2257 (+),score=542.41 TRINITY_DN17034_c0_g1_i1:674-6772(+)
MDASRTPSASSSSISRNGLPASSRPAPLPPAAAELQRCLGEEPVAMAGVAPMSKQTPPSSAASSEFMQQHEVAQHIQALVQNSFLDDVLRPVLTQHARKDSNCSLGTMSCGSEAPPHHSQQEQASGSDNAPAKRNNHVAHLASQHEEHVSVCSPVDISDGTMRRVWKTPEGNADDSNEMQNNTLKYELVDLARPRHVSQTDCTRHVAKSQDQNAQFGSEGTSEDVSPCQLRQQVPEQLAQQVSVNAHFPEGIDMCTRSTLEQVGQQQRVSSAQEALNATIRCMATEFIEQVSQQQVGVAQVIPETEPCAARTSGDLAQLRGIGDRQEVPEATQEAMATRRILEDALEQPAQADAVSSSQDVVVEEALARTAKTVTQSDGQIAFVASKGVPEADMVNTSQSMPACATGCELHAHGPDGVQEKANVSQELAEHDSIEAASVNPETVCQQLSETLRLPDHLDVLGRARDELAATHFSAASDCAQPAQKITDVNSKASQDEFGRTLEERTELSASTASPQPDAKVQPGADTEDLQVRMNHLFAHAYRSGELAAAVDAVLASGRGTDEKLSLDELKLKMRKLLSDPVTSGQLKQALNSSFRIDASKKKQSPRVLELAQADLEPGASNDVTEAVKFDERDADTGRNSQGSLQGAVALDPEDLDANAPQELPKDLLCQPESIVQVAEQHQILVAHASTASHTSGALEPCAQQGSDSCLPQVPAAASQRALDLHCAQNDVICAAENVARANAAGASSHIILQERANDSEGLPNATKNCSLEEVLQQPETAVSAAQNVTEIMQSLEQHTDGKTQDGPQDPGTVMKAAPLQHVRDEQINTSPSVPGNKLESSPEPPAHHAQHAIVGDVQKPSRNRKKSRPSQLGQQPPKPALVSVPQSVRASPPGSEPTSAKMKRVQWASDKRSEEASTASTVAKDAIMHDVKALNAQDVLAGGACAGQSDSGSVPQEISEASGRQSSGAFRHPAPQGAASSLDAPEAKQDDMQQERVSHPPHAAPDKMVFVPDAVAKLEISESSGKQSSGAPRPPAQQGGASPLDTPEAKQKDMQQDRASYPPYAKPDKMVLVSQAVAKLMQQETTSVSSAEQEGTMAHASAALEQPPELDIGSASPDSLVVVETRSPEPVQTSSSCRGMAMAPKVLAQAKQQNQEETPFYPAMAAAEQRAQEQRFFAFQAERLGHKDYEERRAERDDAKKQRCMRREALRQDALAVKRHKEQRAAREAARTVSLLTRHLCYRGAIKLIQAWETAEGKVMSRDQLQKTAIAAFRAKEERKLWEACEAEAAAAAKKKRPRELAPSRRRAEEQRKMHSTASKQLRAERVEEEQRLAIVSETAEVLQEVLPQSSPEEELPQSSPEDQAASAEIGTATADLEQEEPKFKFDQVPSEQSGCIAGKGFSSESSRSSSRMAGACTACSRALRIFCTLTTGKSHGWQEEDTDDEGEGDDHRSCRAGLGALRPEAPLHHEAQQQLPGAMESRDEVAAQWPRALTAIMASEPLAATRNSLLALTGGTEAAARGQRRNSDDDGPASEALPANAWRLERLLDSISGTGGSSSSRPRAEKHNAGVVEDAGDATSPASSPAKCMLEMAAREVAVLDCDSCSSPAKSMLEMAASRAQGAAGAAAAKELVNPPPRRQTTPEALEELSQSELKLCSSAIGSPSMRGMMWVSSRPTSAGRTSAGRTSAVPSPMSSRPSSTKQAGPARSLFSRPASAASSRVRPTCAVEAAEEVEAALADAASPSSSSSPGLGKAKALLDQKQQRKQPPEVEELERQLQQQDLELRRLQQQQQDKQQLRKLRLQLEDQLSQMPMRAGLAEAHLGGSRFQVSSSPTKHSASAAWPDLRVLSCRQGSSGRPEMLLGWGKSDPDRHQGVSRLELEMVPLAQEDVCSALCDLASWTMEVFPSDITTGSKVICATAPSSRAECITDDKKPERRVQRLPAHLGAAQEAVQVCLTGLQPGVALALRLRAWQRRENTWGAPGNVLLLVMPLGRTNLGTAGSTKCSAELAVVVASDMLNGIKAVATPAE